MSKLKSMYRRLVNLRIDPRPQIHMVNDLYGKRLEVTRVIEETKKILAKKNILLHATNWVDFLYYETRPYDLILSHQPAHPKFNGPGRCFGKKDYSRAKRLEIMKSNGFPVMPFAVPKDRQALAKLFGSWQVSQVVLKRNDSMRARKIELVTPKEIHTVKWEEGDVFSPILDEDPRTYKVHLLGGSVVGSYVINTPHILDLARLQAYLKRPDFGVFSLGAALESQIKILGGKLLELGVGYSSIDLMYLNGSLVAIELNTNCVGSRIWKERGSDFAKGMAKAIQNIWNSDQKASLEYPFGLNPEVPAA